MAGFEAVDGDACTAAGVLVVNQGGIGNEPVAEHVIAAMISLSKEIPQADRALRQGSREAAGAVRRRQRAVPHHGRHRHGEHRRASGRHLQAGLPDARPGA